MSFHQEKLTRLLKQIEIIKQNILDLRGQYEPQLTKVNPIYRQSAINLIDYLALRQFDIREMQKNLSELGLSSLGRCEKHVSESLNQINKILYSLSSQKLEKSIISPVNFSQSKELLARFTENLLGEKPASRDVRIMVTMPDEAAEDYSLVKKMFLAGMNVARVNCSHGSPDLWLQMIGNIRQAETELNQECAIMMDLGGPKMRTGRLSPRRELLKLSPHRNELGQIVDPAQVIISLSDNYNKEDIPELPTLFFDLPQELKVGDEIYFWDTRHKKRVLKICQPLAKGYLAEMNATAYLNLKTNFKLSIENGKPLIIKLLKILAQPQPLVLSIGDTLILRKEAILGRNAIRDAKGQITQAAEIACQMPEIFGVVKVGEIVRFDDGKIEGRIEQTSPEAIEIKITMAEIMGSKLRAEKAINFPQTHIEINPLTSKDLNDLDFVCQNADMVALSFVHQAEDILLLEQAIRQRKAQNLKIVVKIETHQAFKNLPDILLTLMQHTSAIGVMIARGDLAVEIGWVRLAEVQEEILWLCEAAHIPVIWATQVLETLAKKGIPSRAEITDAAMSQRAECVMLNKGPFILKAIDTLNEILNTMQMHQLKKTAQLRRLAVSGLRKNKEETN
jgi:pyruvate kinase